MRRLATALALAVLATQLAAETTPSVSAAPATPALSAGEARLASPLAVFKKKKTKKKSSSSVKLTIDDIGNVRRGEDNVLIRAHVRKSGLTCELSVKYADGSKDSPDDVTSDSNGTCSMHVDVPNRKAVVGNAVATVRVVDSKGKEQAKKDASFKVR